ncbi:MAG TPA: TetR/AcrR family transcriptional regulator [Acidimicrobiia bacterium]|nr:TetR/AcrR family transcriptional regulator [Acidimicrobiia bacterium]
MAVKTEPPNKSRKAVQGKATRDGLIGAARALFGDRGYAETALDEVVATAGVTKGALYHHFSGKEDLFLGVFRAVKDDLNRQFGDALAEPEPWDDLVRACRVFIEVHTDPAVQRIVLLDAPAVLSAETIQDVDRSSGAVMLRFGLRRAMNRGVIERQPLMTLAAVLSGALTEACVMVARSENPDEARAEAVAVVERLLAGLRVPEV